MARTEINFRPKATVVVSQVIEHETQQDLDERDLAIKADIATALQRAMDRGEIDLAGYNVYIAFEDVGEPTFENLEGAR